MKVSELHIGFVGFGHMAQVICRAMEQSRIVPRSQISFTRRDKNAMLQNEKEFGITSTSLENLVRKSDLILVCVRPPQAELVLRDMAEIGVGSKMIVSILAGTMLSVFEKYLGTEAQLLRVMPNMASAVAEGMSVFSYGAHHTNDFKSYAHLLFSNMGQVLEVPEKLMDISCGIAGSGPAFVIALIEAMARAGEKNGIEYQKSLLMAAQTFLGAAKMIVEGGQPETLLQQITVPNGTTEAGLKILREKEMKKHLEMVVEASALRSKQISEGKH